MSDIKLFKFEQDKVIEVFGESATLEKNLQNIIEKHLFDLIGVNFLASEYAIAEGRMDTIGIDENNCPVIIEYKRNKNENVINQGLFYLDWLIGHKKDFEWLVMEQMGKELAKKVDWSAPRLICIAGGYTKYDEHAVKQINHNIELVRYVKYGTNLLALELVNAKSISNSSAIKTAKKRQNNKANAIHMQKNNNEFVNMFEDLKNYIFSLGDDIQYLELKKYYAFKRLKNFVCIKLKPRKKTIVLTLSLDPKQENYTNTAKIRDVSSIGHWGTGDFEFSISNDKDFEEAKPYIEKAYHKS